VTGVREREEHEWGAMVWHPVPDPRAELSLAEMTIRAGHVSPPHRHGNCEEVLFVREGTVVVVIDGVAHEIGTEESLHVPRHLVHHVEGGDEDASLLIVWSAAQREYEEVPPGD
jgi:mannose-6-phosphate isomerase-like protein (cupin superfamily)